MHDFKTGKWDLGDMGGTGTQIYDNCSLVRLDPHVQKSDTLPFSVIATGGYYNGFVSNYAVGIRFL